MVIVVVVAVVGDEKQSPAPQAGPDRQVLFSTGKQRRAQLNFFRNLFSLFTVQRLEAQAASLCSLQMPQWTQSLRSGPHLVKSTSPGNTTT
ncbi:hypothetical protein INR49_009397 [Caranx melampygus]|nr:hypothetical protein INR49_009397 [Caranx melampygus]